MYLDVLKRRNVTATFFVSGYSIIKNPSKLLREAKEGHEIGHHSWNHTNSQSLINDIAAFEYDMGQTSNLIFNITKLKPKLIRPPFGSYNQATMNKWYKDGMVPVIWDIDSNDWRNPTRADLAFQNIVNKLKLDTTAGHLVLCHDIIPTCLQHLDDIIDLFLSNNYTFVTTSDCIEEDAYKE
eukprot:NODE_47_length_27404_cov_0.284270.p9 type:complete len:182 gc:universal NODE_47_length_27404_cov_0.284270:16085-16630(+)